MSSNAFSELEREYSESLDYTERYTQMLKELAEAEKEPDEGDERNI
ncbi:hypothetical protein UFOVP1320_32 [uncultured Caudovirales phage]|uniref:Uncharacterized protein n=1 Tax=uncultured Caudovirales phage TaxID=2100421 RepID=A0A6J5PLE1_9CAUD|nr:hypothetical protein UFOVP548_47 [uncultured Caudovirales phage]CAB4170171.1 hypothetical protein UFOVP904_47 [uncultured Caudovirales phage]CAB4182567.1 hypothetical protein UFOVP1079_28 [uncultured Caudovirales phage]CAB4197776.1 hypothetical protein UFOVP1320_32 [uncultured Caudovirales phage]CAB4211703.1 hypothetical protein UFOVP1431_23 [uncultured Caudovirales phage]